MFKISLAEWSLHEALFDSKMDHLDFPDGPNATSASTPSSTSTSSSRTRPRTTAYLAELKKRGDDNGVKSVLIMIDGEGDLGDPDESKRHQGGREPSPVGRGGQVPRLPRHPRQRRGRQGRYEEQMKLAADGLRRLTEFGAQHEINVIVENHGGLSSNGEWLAGVMRWSIYRTAARCPTSATSASATAKSTTATRASPS